MNDKQPYSNTTFLCSVKLLVTNTPFLHVQSVKFDDDTKMYVEDTKGRFWGHGAVQCSSAHYFQLNDICHVYDAGFGLVAVPAVDAVRKVTLVAQIGAETWTANDTVTGLPLPTGEHVDVIGSPVKVGLELIASRKLRVTGDKKWFAVGYPPTQIDFGTNWITNPFVYADGVMKLKIKTTTNGRTWVASTINLDQTIC